MEVSLNNTIFIPSSIIISGSDKISVPLFADFLKAKICPEHHIFFLNYLMTAEEIEKHINSYRAKFIKNIFCYYVKRKGQIDPNLIIPSKLKDMSEILVWFDIYNAVPVILRDEHNFIESIMNRWKDNIKRLNP